MPRTTGGQDSCSPSKQNLAQAFFSGQIRDKTTKESRKAAESLAALKTIKKNPTWVPVDNSTKMLKRSAISSSELAKMQAQIGDTVPSEIVMDTARHISESSTTASHSKGMSFKNPMLCDVEAEIHRRIHSLGKSGKMFEENASYTHDQQLAADAPLIVQGIDPQAARSEDRFVRSRIITPQRKHWMASKQGFYTTPFGMAYVHTDGSIAIFPHGTEHKCRCGAVHMT